jgi:hypothetical protein
MSAAEQPAEIEPVRHSVREDSDELKVVRWAMYALFGLMALAIVGAIIAMVMGAWVTASAVSAVKDSDLLIQFNPLLWVGKTLAQVQAWAASTKRPLRITRVNDFSYSGTVDYVAARVNVEVRLNVAALVAMSPTEAMTLAQSQPQSCTVNRVTMG